MKKYGRCIIPSGTLLFRSCTVNNKSHIFLALKSFIADSFNRNENKRIQVWKVIEDIEVLFMVSQIKNQTSHVESSIVEIYKDILPDEIGADISDLSIKAFNKKRLNILIKELKRMGIKGWLSSLENRVELEICLFNKKLLKRVGSCNADKYILHNSLEGLIIYPSKIFYTKSKKNLTGYKAKYSDHKKWYNYTVKNANEYGQSIEEAKHDYFDLRLKLKL